MCVSGFEHCLYRFISFFLIDAGCSVVGSLSVRKTLFRCWHLLPLLDYLQTHPNESLASSVLRAPLHIILAIMFYSKAAESHRKKMTKESILCCMQTKIMRNMSADNESICDVMVQRGEDRNTWHQGQVKVQNLKFWCTQKDQTQVESQRCSQNRQDVGWKVKLKKREKKANTELRNRQMSYTRNVKTLKHKQN